MGVVLRMKKMINECKIIVREHKGKRSLERPGSGQGTMVGFFENHNEISGPIKGGEFLGQLRDHQFIKKDFTPWSNGALSTIGQEVTKERAWTGIIRLSSQS
jgi:hypothetical protein